MDTKSKSASRWRWVVLASSFCSLLLIGFGQNNAGVMKVVLLSHMENDVITTTWLVSYYTSCFALTAPVGSVLINLVNCRACVVLSGVLCLVGYVLSSLVTDVFYLFFTLTLVGIGQGMSNTGSLVILSYYFPDKTAIATGVSIAGGALGIFIHPPLLQALVDWYGLRGAFLLSGAVAFQGSVCGALMRPARKERESEMSKRHGNVFQGICHLINDAISGHMTLLMSWPVLTILLSAFSLSLGLFCLLVQLPSYLIQCSGLSSTEAAFSISVYGIGSLFSRLVSGFIAHDTRIGNLLLYAGTTGVNAMVTLAAPALLSEGIVGSYSYCFMVGLYSGGASSLVYPALYDVVGLNHLSAAFGMALFAMGIGGLLGAPLSQLIYDADQDPYLLFGFVSAMFCASTVFRSLGAIVPAKPVGKRHLPPDTHPSTSNGVYRDERADTQEQTDLLSHTAATVIEMDITDPAEKVKLLRPGSTNQHAETPTQESANIAANSEEKIPVFTEIRGFTDLKNEMPEQENCLSPNVAAISEKETDVPRLRTTDKHTTIPEQENLLSSTTAAITEQVIEVPGEKVKFPKLRITDQQDEIREQESLLSSNITAITEKAMNGPTEKVKSRNVGLADLQVGIPEQENLLSQNVAAVAEE